MILAVYNTVLIPIEVSFDPDFLEMSVFFYVDSVIDFLFFIDICINFWYAYLNTKTGEEVKDWKKIAIKYLSTRFTIDVLSTIPFDNIVKFIFWQNSVVLRFFGLLKLIRVLRLSRIITFFNFEEDT